jgi:hypothetical protein
VEVTVLASAGTTTALPILSMARAQSELIWLYHDSESAMGKCSNFGVFVALLEGASGSTARADLVLDPQSALNDVLENRRIRAARRSRPLIQRLSRCSSDSRETLRAVFGSLPQSGFESFGMLGPIIPTTHAAQRFHVRSQSSADLITWLVRLNTKLIGQVIAKGGNGRTRKNPTASEKDILIHATILEEAREIVRDALREFDRAGGQS